MNFLLFIGAVVCSLIFFGGALYFYWIFFSNNKRDSLHNLFSHPEADTKEIEHCIDASTAKILQSLHDTKIGIGQIIQSKDIKNIEDELKEIKKILNTLSYDSSQRFETIELFVTEIKNQNEPEISIVSKNIGQTEKHGYFGFPISQKYLKFQIDKTDDCFFSALINDKDKGTYDLLSLDKIKSEDGLDHVIKFVGNVRKSEARYHKVIKEGVASKIDDRDLWKIENPLIIELS